MNYSHPDRGSSRPVYPARADSRPEPPPPQWQPDDTHWEHEPASPEFSSRSSSSYDEDLKHATTHTRPVVLPPRNAAPAAHEEAPPRSSLKTAILEWTPTALMISYFAFSISLYCVLNDTATKVFWFLYLSIATILALTTTLEAYDGLTPLRDARKAMMKFDKSDTKFTTADDDLPFLELIIDINHDNLNHIPDFAFLRRVRSTLSYPNEKVRVNLVCREHSTAHSAANHYYDQLESDGVRICSIPAYACTSLAARIAFFFESSHSPLGAIVAIFSARERPHPYGVRHAVEKLVQDAKVQVIQGRSIAVPQRGQSAFFTAISLFEHDMVHALLRPGRCLTWGLTVAHDTNTYWRLDTLRSAATPAASRVHDGQDLGFTAVANGAKTIYDLRATAYEPCPRGFAKYIASRAEFARAETTATSRYSSLAFRKNGAAESSAATKWTLKTRFAVLYTLPILQIASHAVLQYLCMAVALLSTRTPSSTMDFAYTIYFPYPITQWFMTAGLVCLAMTIFMVYKARSEFLPLRTAPLVLALYPLLLAWRACLEVFAQVEVLVR